MARTAKSYTQGTPGRRLGIDPPPGGRLQGYPTTTHKPIPHKVLATPNPSAGQKAHAAHAEAAKPTPTPKTPPGMIANPVAKARGVKTP